MRIADEVASALADGRPVVALESTILAHGLPRPENLRVGREIEAAVRDEGAVPATIAVLDGEVRVGLDDAGLREIAERDDVLKLGVRDLGPALVRRAPGATTVASTATIAARAGISAFATGGLGGVHRGASETFDESADLLALADAPVVVVCAGVKSILDVGATLERLETLSVPVLGFGTDRMPGFYLSDSGHAVPWRVDDAAEVAAIQRARRDLGLRQAVVVANPLPEDEAMDPALHDRVLIDALTAAEEEGVAGKEATPFVLGRFHAGTGGESLRVNVTLVLRNAALAARIAGALAG
ncbi:MAG TPA: pseudouridine-5'-phosphate glycosidase [Miltoncostaeaceae bacterium]|nr:pseudouridine-5'-phosphate glycosidase [Miltoncostaeaceae bacterium]